MDIHLALCFLSIAVTVEWSAAHIPSELCGSCVCNQAPKSDSEVSYLPGRPGKMGPKGSKGEAGIPGVPDGDLVTNVVDEKVKNLTAKVAKLDSTVSLLSDHIKTLQDGISLLLLMHQQKDCRDIKTGSGVYIVYPDAYKQGLEVFCDQETELGGWTVIQRRKNGSIDFYRDWSEYLHGFGNVAGEFWIGLEKLHQLTKGGKHELRIDVEDFPGDKAFARYSHFKIGDGTTDYTLTATGYSGYAGDGLKYHNGMKFSTKDRDNDISTRDCAGLYTGSWWYNDCHHSNLNGQYYDHQKVSSKGVAWYAWRKKHLSLKFAEMKIRPK